MLQTAAEQIGIVIFAAVCGFALWRGDRWARLAALALITAVAATVLLQERERWIDPQYAVLAVDTALLLTLVALARASRRRWLLWATAFQLLAVATHLAVIIDLRVMAWAYITIAVAWSYAMLGALAAGAWQAHMSRLRSERTPG